MPCELNTLNHDGPCKLPVVPCLQGCEISTAILDAVPIGPLLKVDHYYSV